MRPADICNPHVKDEHPGSARLRRSLAVSAAIHAATPASSSWNPDHGRLFANPGGGPAATLTPPSPTDGGGRHPSPGRGRFPRRPVKSDGCHDPRRLPPSSGSPRTLGSRNRLRLRNPSTHFASAGFPTEARPPSPTPAATEVASLGQTLLDDFCNQDRIRGTPHGIPDLTRTAMARDSLRSQPRGPTRREPCVPATETAGDARWGATHGPSYPRASLHAAVQRPTLECSSTPLVAARRTAGLESRR